MGLGQSTLIAASLTTHWFSPIRALKRVDYPLPCYARQVLFPSCTVGLSIYLMCRATQLSLSNDLTVLLCMACTAGFIWLVSVCGFVLTREDRVDMLIATRGVFAR